MFPLSPSLWLAVGAAVLIAALSGAVYVQTSRLEAVKQEYATFKAEVKATGEAAQKVADAQKAADKAKKENTDAKHKKAVADLADTIKRLRDSRPSGDLVPAAPANSRSPEVAAFDRAELSRAVRTFDTEVQGLIDEGAKATVDLNAAKEWAK